MGNYFPEGMPLPAGDRDTHGFWDAAKNHELVVQRCNRCGTYRMTPVPVCYECQSFDWSWVKSNGIGEIYTYSIVHHPPHPATRDVVPYNIVVVKLRDCGEVAITSNLIDSKNEDIYCGMPVEVCWEDTTPEVTVPRFRPLKTS